MTNITVLLFLSLLLKGSQQELKLNAGLISNKIKDTDAVKMAAQACKFYEDRVGGIPDCFSYYEFLGFLSEEIQMENAYWLLRSDKKVDKKLEQLRNS